MDDVDIVHCRWFTPISVTFPIVKSCLVTDGWLPGRYLARWRKEEFARAVRRAGWNVLELKVITNRERKGRWLNLLAQKQT